MVLSTLNDLPGKDCEEKPGASQNKVVTLAHRKRDSNSCLKDEVQRNAEKHGIFHAKITFFRW